jgi:hypothetical protein
MSSKAISYGELDTYLTSLGYHRKTAPTHVVYAKVGAELPVILPKIAKKEAVRPAHLVAIEQILVLDGVIKKGQLAYSLGRASAKRSVRKPSSKSAAVELTNPEVLSDALRKAGITRSSSSRTARRAKMHKILADTIVRYAATSRKSKGSSA